MLLDDVKELMEHQNIRVPSDSVINLYIKRAIYTIKNYLNNDRLTGEDVELLHSEAIVSLVVDAQRVETSGSKGIKSMSQGARSITYADEKSFTITDDIKTLLPVPYVKMR